MAMWNPWRVECWDIIRERQDLHFLFLTKRIERFSECVPKDWGSGYDHVTVGCTVEDQAAVNKRLEFFSRLPVKHKNITCQSLIKRVELEQYLTDIELVVAGGESDRNARPLDYEWILDIWNQCLNRSTHFEFRQCGTHFIKDGKVYNLNTRDLCSQAKKANIDV